MRRRRTPPKIRVNPETQVIEDAKFKTFGCGSTIASSSLATEWVKGKTVAEALTISNTDIVKELALPPVKIHCSVLAERNPRRHRRLEEEEQRHRRGPSSSRRPPTKVRWSARRLSTEHKLRAEGAIYPQPGQRPGLAAVKRTEG